MCDFNIIANSALFSSIAPEDIEPLLKCLETKTAVYKKGAYIIAAGDAVHYVGTLISGRLSIFKEDADGERALLSQIHPGDHFAETLCCAGIENSPVYVLAETDARVLQINFKKVLHLCSNACVFHAKLLENMLMVLAEKNLYLQERMAYLSKKTIRQRVMKYLFAHAKGTHKTFAIPYSREELAEYLCVDRSALSRELSKLKEEKVIDYWKNQFKVIENPNVPQ